MTRTAIADGIKKLAEIPGDEDVILVEEEETQLESTAEVPEPSSIAEEPPTAEKLPAATKPQDAGKQPVNLDDFAEFRKFKSKTDQAATEKAQRIAQLEEELARRRESEAQVQQTTIAAQIGQTADPNARQQLIDQLAAIRSAQYVDGWHKWEQHMAAEIEKAAVDANDPRFKKQYSGPEGAVQFERDLLEARLEQAQQRATAAEQKLKDLPTQVDSLVKKQFAELARQRGFDSVDVGEERQPPVSADTVETEQAIQDLNQGRISLKEFKRRTGG